MQQSAGSTDTLGKSVDSLGAKINNALQVRRQEAARDHRCRRRADHRSHRGLGQLREADVSAAARRRRSSTRTRDAETKVMKDYTAAVKELRSEYGTTTTEAAKLIESSPSCRPAPGAIKDLAKVFTEMSHATGESSRAWPPRCPTCRRSWAPRNPDPELRGPAHLPGGADQHQRHRLIDFTAQLAPIGRAMGMTQTQVTGFATIFAKAGQDGYRRCHRLQQGHPGHHPGRADRLPGAAQVRQPAGGHRQQFKEMGGQEQVARLPRPDRQARAQGRPGAEPVRPGRDPDVARRSPEPCRPPVGP